MDWTDCPLIEQIPGKMSGAPVVRGTRMRPQDIVGNSVMGAEWIAEAHGMRIEDVHAVLAFWADHHNELPLEYFHPHEVDELGVDKIDWSECPAIERHPQRLSGAPVIRGTPVRAIDLVAYRAEGENEDDLARVYDLPVETVRSVLNYYDQRHRRKQLAPAV